MGFKVEKRTDGTFSRSYSKSGKLPLNTQITVSNQSDDRRRATPDRASPHNDTANGMAGELPVALSEEQLSSFEELARSVGLDLKPGVARSLTGLLALGAAPHSLQTVIGVIVQNKSTPLATARRPALASSSIGTSQ